MSNKRDQSTKRFGLDAAHLMVSVKDMCQFGSKFTASVRLEMTEWPLLPPKHPHPHRPNMHWWRPALCQVHGGRAQCAHNMQHRSHWAFSQKRFTEKKKTRPATFSTEKAQNLFITTFSFFFSFTFGNCILFVVEWALVKEPHPPSSQSSVGL